MLRRTAPTSRELQLARITPGDGRFKPVGTPRELLKATEQGA